MNTSVCRPRHWSKCITKQSMGRFWSYDSVLQGCSAVTPSLCLQMSLNVLRYLFCLLKSWETNVSTTTSAAWTTKSKSSPIYRCLQNINISNAGIPANDFMTPRCVCPALPAACLCFMFTWRGAAALPSSGCAPLDCDSDGDDPWPGGHGALVTGSDAPDRSAPSPGIEEGGKRHHQSSPSFLLSL